MGMLKQAEGSSLADTGVLDDPHLHKLRALGVTTVEDLLGLIAADVVAVQHFTELTDLVQLQARLAPFANLPVAERGELEGASLPKSLGAVPPAGVPVEQVAQFDTFDSYREAVDLEAVAPSELRVDLRGRFGLVRDQGDRGTCVGHACASVAEAVLGQQSGPPSLSPQFVYFQAKQLDGLPLDVDGTFAATAMATAADVGVCLEQLWPYEPQVIEGNLTHGPPPPAAVADAADHRVTGATVLTANASLEVVAALDSGLPVVLSIPVYRSWKQNPAVDLTGIIPMPLPNSPLEGGHAMVAVGYGYDAEDIPGGWYFMLRNSWGFTWASEGPFDPGYGVLPFLYVDNYGWEAVTVS